MASSRPATSSSCGRRRAAAAGAGVASTTASASNGLAAAATVQPPDDARSSRSAGEESRMSTPRAPQAAANAPTSDAMPPSSAQKSGGPSGSGAGTSARRARMRPPRRCAAASRGGKVAAADMSSTEPAWIPPMRGSTIMSTTRRPSLRDTSGPMARSPIGPADVGSGQHGIAGESQRAAEAHDARAGRRPEPGRDPECVALGQRAQAPAGPDRRTPGRDRHERVGQSHLVAQVDRLAPTPEEPVRAQVDDPSPEVLALQGAAQAR